MKKLTLLALSLVASSAVIASEGFCVKPYVGVDAHAKSFSIKDLVAKTTLKTSIPSVGVFAGVDLNDYFGVEIGSSIHGFKKRSNEKHRLQSLSVTGMGYLPLAEDLSLVGGVGMSHNRVKVQHTTSNYVFSFKKGAPRFLGGLKYNMTDYLDVRSIFTYDNLSKMKYSGQSHSRKGKHAYSVGLGLVYKI